MPNSCGDQRRQVHGAVLAARSSASSISSGASCSTNTRSKCALGGSAPARPSAASCTSSRASARLASRPSCRAPASRRRRPAPAIARREQQPVVLRHRLVGDRSSSCRTSPAAASVTPIWLPSDLDILRAPSMPTRSRHRQDRLLGLAVGALDVAPQQQVELLVGPPQLDVGVDRHRVIALQQRVQQLEQRDRLAAPTSVWRSPRARAAAPRSSCARAPAARPSACPATRRCAAPPGARDRRRGSAAPAPGRSRALASISSRGEHRAQARAARRVADARRVVADDQHHPVAGVLELAQLAQHDRVAEVDVRRRRVDAQLDPQRPALLRAPPPACAASAPCGQAVDGVARQPGGQPRQGPRRPRRWRSASAPMLDSRRARGSLSAAPARGSRRRDIGPPRRLRAAPPATRR